LEVRILLKGTAKRWPEGRSFGFIKPDDGGDDVFVHNSQIQGASSLREGQRVEFDVERTDRGLRAINVKLIE